MYALRCAEQSEASIEHCDRLKAMRRGAPPANPSSSLRSWLRMEASVDDNRRLYDGRWLFRVGEEWLSTLQLAECSGVSAIYIDLNAGKAADTIKVHLARWAKYSSPADRKRLKDTWLVEEVMRLTGLPERKAIQVVNLTAKGTRSPSEARAYNTAQSKWSYARKA